MKPQISSGKEHRLKSNHSVPNYQLEKIDNEIEACAVCHGTGGSILRCESCRYSFHPPCCNMPIPTVAKAPWYCGSCVKKIARNTHSPQPLQSASPSQHQQYQQQQHQPQQGRRMPKNNRGTTANNQTITTTSSSSRSNKQTPEGGKRASNKQSLGPSKHVSQLVNNEREVMVSSGIRMDNNGFSPEEGDDNTGGQYIRVFYANQTRKVDAITNLTSLYNKKLYYWYPELRKSNFNIYYTDDEGEKINIIDEECFSIFLGSDIPKDLFITLNHTQ